MRSGHPNPYFITIFRRKNNIGGHFLKGRQDPVCQPDSPFGEVLFGVLVKDIAKKLPSLVYSSNYYLLLLFHVCTNVTL